MSKEPEYTSDWKRRVGDAILSYKDVMEDLIDGREYHGSRSFLPPDDKDADPRGIYIEIPLLWGRF